MTRMSSASGVRAVHAELAETAERNNLQFIYCHGVIRNRHKQDDGKRERHTQAQNAVADEAQGAMFP
jgi:hypothetical protein